MQALADSLNRLIASRDRLETDFKENRTGPAFLYKMTLLQAKIDQLEGDIEEFHRSILESIPQLTPEEHERLQEYRLADKRFTQALFISHFLAGQEESQ